jgi:hypothetical protein
VQRPRGRCISDNPKQRTGVKHNCAKVRGVLVGPEAIEVMRDRCGIEAIMRILGNH